MSKRPLARLSPILPVANSGLRWVPGRRPKGLFAFSGYEMTDESRLEPLPYYKWLWKDWRANRSVQRMSYIERGLYRELLDECWSEGSIPDDIESLAEICGCPESVMADAWHVLSKCFANSGGRLTNEKLDSLRTDLDRVRVKKQDAGRAGGLAKALNRMSSVAPASTCQASASISHIEEVEKSREESEKERSSVDDSLDGRPSKPKVKSGKTTLATWLASCQASGDDPIPEGDPIFAWADSVQLPDDYLALAWDVFKRDMTDKGKLQTDWRATFRNYVRKGYLKLWAIGPDGYFLTTVGKQEAMAHGQS